MNRAPSPPSLADYHVPLHLDVPEIALIWLDEPDPHAPMGARGIGEIGITGVGAAVVHAVATPPANVSAIFPSLLNKLF